MWYDMHSSSMPRMSRPYSPLLPLMTLLYQSHRPVHYFRWCNHTFVKQNMITCVWSGLYKDKPAIYDCGLSHDQDHKSPSWCKRCENMLPEKTFFSAEMKEPLFLHSVCLVTDTEAERNALKEHIYPKLRDFCRENYGIEFQVKDVWWMCMMFVPAELVDFLVHQK